MYYTVRYQWKNSITRSKNEDLGPGCKRICIHYTYIINYIHYIISFIHHLYMYILCSLIFCGRSNNRH